MARLRAGASAESLLRHFVAALRYRFEKVARDAPTGFDDVAIGHGVRTPAEILGHMSDVLAFAIRRVEGDETYQGPPSLPTDWPHETRRFRATVDDLDRVLVRAGALPADLAHRLLQGPLADAMTHVGQLAMLRRVAGAPVDSEDFFIADVRAYDAD